MDANDLNRTGLLSSALCTSSSNSSLFYSLDDLGY